jgi:restriction endonuclease S subunit
MSTEARRKPGWRTFRFDEIATNVNERVDDPSEAGVDYYVGLEHLDSDSLTIRRWGSPADVQATKLRFREGDIIFGRRRVYQRKLGVAHFDGICSAHAMVLRAKPDVVLSEFLPFFMQSDLFMDRAKEISVGSLSPTINWPALAREQFLLPPLDEQRRLRDALIASEAASATLNQLLTRHSNLRRAAIDGLTENDSWPAVSVGDVCSMQNGKAFPGADYTSDGIALLRPGNLGADGYLSWEATKTVRLSHKWKRDAADFVVAPGDVLMNLTAQSLEDGFMGRVCLAREGDQSLLNQRIGRFRDWRAGVTPEYVFRVFQSSRYQSHAIEMCEGSKVKHIFWPYIARYLFKLPPRQVQDAVVNSLRQVDRMFESLRLRLASHRRVHQRLIAATVGEAALARTLR